MVSGYTIDRYTALTVIAGLDQATRASAAGAGCRVKPGNDGEGDAYGSMQRRSYNPTLSTTRTIRSFGTTSLGNPRIPACAGMTGTH